MTSGGTPNFASLAGNSPHGNDSPRYREYRQAWLENPSKFFLAGFPLHLDVEASSRCNLRCVFCDRRPALEGQPQGDMDFTLWRTIIEEASRNGLYALKFSYRGEPLLNPKLPDMVAMAKQLGILDVYFNTNGMLLNQEVSRALIDSGLDRISISVEGTDPVMYEQGRLGASFTRVANNISGLIALRERMGASNPKVRVQTVCLPGLDIEAYATYWKQYADEVAAVDYVKYGQGQTAPVSGFACPQPWQRLTITWDGMVLPCNNDNDFCLPLGRIPQRTITQCWTDPKLMELRDLHRQGRSHLAGPCHRCPWRAAQIDKMNKADPARTI